ncbi:MAG TPA: HD-GYP domain-containing protein [Rhodocyclaceae bacterium]|nr:HD-GYP domain-containing protein [Rhodocyclaceae bacterium]
MPEPLTVPDKPRFRKVPLAQLRTGMFVCDLQTRWLYHSFWRKEFLIEDDRMLARLHQDAIREVVIDTRRGLDIEPAAAPEVMDVERFAALDQRRREAARQRKELLRQSVTLAEERRRMQFFRRDALATLDALTESIRIGQPPDIARTEPLVERMIDSVRRHPDALIPLLQVKDRYDRQHPLSVAAMMLGLGLTLGLDEGSLRQAAQGALLKDIGSLRIPEDILQKPERLTDYEMRVVRRHVFDSQLMLADSAGVTETMLDVVAHHHERVDGTGYPHALAGEEVPVHAQLTAIVDAYDALTSDRPFQQRVEPGEALRRLHAEAGSHFRPDLLQAFVRTVGVYPVGSLVRLDNGYLAIVTEVHRDRLLQPELLVMFDTRSDRYVSPFPLDLARKTEPPAIVGIESYARWGIDPRRWQIT